jgi:carbon monoxide dehydrogenase subunit G
MDMQGSRVLNATQEQAWQALNDPDILKACIPGCDKFELAEPNVYAVGVAIKIGPVAAKFTGKVSLMDIVPPNSYALQFEAQGGIAGFGKGESKVELKPVDGGVELNYTVHSQVGGKIAQLGQRLIDGVAKTLAEDFFNRFEEQLQARHGGGAEASTASDANSESTEATGATPTWVWAFAIVIAASVVWFITR